jgi:transcriptional regulator with XRE-family HTH domain
MVKRENGRDFQSRVQMVGRRISETRHSLRMTQAQFAEKVERSISVVQEWERGRNFTLKSLFMIAGALGCPVEILFKQPHYSKSRRGRPTHRSK